jgi:predicted AlkP superfamily pyrophosphatase or phosphodiesterase
MYEDQVKTFVRYQSDLARRAILRNSGADLMMIYIEEPDGSGHQFTLTDRRQATSFTDPNTIGDNQDKAKVARYASYVKFAYQQADRAVGNILDLVGHRSNVFVVSDHGMSPFHTAVSLANILRNGGVDVSQLAVRTSGAAATIYVNLQGRELGGTVSVAAYQTLVNQVAGLLQNAQDTNPRFNYSLRHKRIFTHVVKRPFNCPQGIGFCTSSTIGQDFGDVFVMLGEGYNFDGIQNPGVARLGDPAFNSATTEFSQPNFYGAHGHDPNLPSMSAPFIAAGPDIGRGTIRRVANIDVAPTIMRLLGVKPAKTVDGRVLWEIFD